VEFYKVYRQNKSYQNHPDFNYPDLKNVWAIHNLLTANYRLPIANCRLRNWGGVIKVWGFPKSYFTTFTLAESVPSAERAVRI